MKIIIKNKNLPGTAEQIARQAGYGYIIDRRRDKDSFVRHLGNGRYPRFHLYIKTKDDQVIFDLHLDQKETSYKGVHMHNAEYDGEVVAAEILRLKELISSLYRKEIKMDNDVDLGPANDIQNDLEKKIGYGEIKKDYKPIKKKWWQKIFS